MRVSNSSGSSDSDNDSDEMTSDWRFDVDELAGSRAVEESDQQMVIEKLR